MKLWKKLSLLAIVTILFATGIFGSIIVYQTANYNLNQTISSYQKQVKSTAYAMEQEIRNSAMKSFGDATKKSYMQYILRKYGGTDYMLLGENGVVCNLTGYDLKAREKMPEWKEKQVDYIIQHRERQYVLIMGKEFAGRGNDTYQLILIKNISNLYEDIMNQVLLLAAIYLAVTLLAVFVIFCLTKRMLRPLDELQQTAARISEGDFSQRVYLKSRDEVGKVADAFNKMADRVEQQVEELEEVSERRKHLLGSLTHELKTPMTSIIGYSDTLLHVKISQEQQKKALEHINRECKRLERLSGKMMNLVGLYNNESVCLGEYSVQELLERVAELERYHVQEKGMKLIVTCAMDKVRMDVDLMESLLVNLIDNAIKASREGDTIDVLAMNNRITVRDWGKGIPLEEIPKITEAFYMVDKSRSKKAGGIGLGLALCKQIAELHHGHLEIESWLDDGTSISIVFDEEAGSREFV